MKDERVYTVYMHTCLKNNKRYIGMTKQCPEKRWNKGRAYSGCRFFNSAIKKYGWDNFEHEIILCNLTKCEAEMFEVEMIKYYKTQDRKYGYNLDSGGSSKKNRSESTIKRIVSSNTGRKLSEETKLKISLAHKGKIKSASTREKLSKAHKGKKFSKERCLAMSKARIGKTPTEETKRKMSLASKGKNKTKEHSINISKGHKGKMLSDEHKKKMSLAKLGKSRGPFSESHKLKISISNKGKKLSEERILNLKKFTCKKVENVTTNIAFNSIIEAAKYYGLCKCGIGRACSGKIKTCGGFYWRFLI